MQCGGVAVRIFEHVVAPAFQPTIMRSVWRVMGDRHPAVKDDRYIALRIIEHAILGTLSFSVRSELAPIGKQKIQRFQQKLAKIQVTGLMDLPGPNRDGTRYRIEFGDGGEVSFQWSNAPPPGMSTLVELVDEYLRHVDAALQKLSAESTSEF